MTDQFGHRGMPMWFWILDALVPFIMMAMLLPIVGRVRRRKGLPPILLHQWLLPALGVPTFLIAVVLLSPTRYYTTPFFFIGLGFLVLTCVQTLKGRHLGHATGGRVLAFALITSLVLMIFVPVIIGGPRSGDVNAYDMSWLLIDFSVFVWILAAALRLTPELGEHMTGTKARPGLAATLFVAASIVLLLAMCGPATHHVSQRPYFPLAFAASVSRLALRFQARRSEHRTLAPVHGSGS